MAQVSALYAHSDNHACWQRRLWRLVSSTAAPSSTNVTRAHCAALLQLRHGAYRNCPQSCACGAQRFRRLAGDARLWRLVTGAATPADAAGGRRLAGRHGRRAYATLQAAVAASR